MLNKFQYYMLFVWLILASGAGMTLYTGNEGDTAAGSAVIQVVYAAFYFFFFVVVVFEHKRILSIITREKWIMVLWTWCLLSFLWSVEPSLTLRRTIALLGVIIIGLFVAIRLEPKQQIRLVAWVVGITAVASLAVCILMPQSGVSITGEWKGVFHQKNVLGHTMALGIFCFAFLFLSENRRRWLYGFFIALCGGLMLMSQSVTAVSVTLVMLAVLYFRRVFRLPIKTLTMATTAFLAIAIPAFVWFFSNIEGILTAVGRDPSLTGRVPLWHAVVQEIGKRPLLGYGYTAFWYSVEGDRIHSALGWIPMHAHDGYLETTLALGFVGMFILMCGLLANFFRGLRVYAESDTLEEFWPLFFLIFMAVDNIAEVWMLKVNSLIWMLYIANTYWIVRVALEGKRVETEDPDPLPDQSVEVVGFRPLQS
jgi:O-antigen ligase